MENKEISQLPVELENYKFLDLKIYSSTEWLADNQKKYRQVFEKNRLSYVYAELSMINKRYESEDWKANIYLKCYRLQTNGKKEICSLELDRTISKHNHITYIREGWGQKGQGVFWKTGKYCWEAYVNERKLATKYFYIEDLHHKFDDWEHKALTVGEVEFFEGSFDENDEDENRKYFIEFPEADSRYIFLELLLENKYDKTDWMAELFIRFYNQSRELKGQVVRLQKVNKGEKDVQITAGWGSNVKGSWRRGKYTVEVIFMDGVLMTSSFVIGPHFKEGATEFSSNEEDPQQDPAKQAISAKQAYSQLNAMIGLRSIKRQISEHTKYIQFLQLRAQHGFVEQEHITLHSVFMGNPGTGKTTVARLLGAIYHNMGLLKKGHVHEVDRVDLVGEYIGQTAPKVKTAIEKASGGVLFIDEAYALARQNDDSKDFGREVIEMLVKEMSKPTCDFMVVAAGYPQQMEAFVRSNPGLASRFKYEYRFDDYSLDELFEIAHLFAVQYEVVLSDPAREKLHKIITDAYRKREASFGNARYIAQLIEKAKIQLGIRIMKKYNPSEVTPELLAFLTASDIKPLKSVEEKEESQITIDQEALQAAMQKLNQLIGLNDVKEKIMQLVDIVKYRISTGLPITGHIPIHLVLVGNPGTGKTTVARLLSEIYKALGILERGHIIETDRQGLVSGYVGQTAIKTAEKIEEAKGGVLFIDEAYSLVKLGANNDFGDEAIQVLLKQMEDHRGQFSVIAAGYPEQMENFLAANPGLRSRFDHTLHFTDFTSTELLQVAQYFFAERGYKISQNALSIVSQQLDEEYLQRSKTFGNARRVRQYVDEIIKQQSLRLGREDHVSTGRYHVLIKEVDIQAAINMLGKSYQYRRKGVGF